MKISNFSKLMLIAAFALAGNAAYKMLQNRTGQCALKSECTAAQQSDSCPCETTENAPVAQIAVQDAAPIQTALRDEQYMDENDTSAPDSMKSSLNNDEEEENDEDADYETPRPDVDDIE